jgi:hypothetical protein
MSRTYRDQRRYVGKHRVWIRAWEPGRNHWVQPWVRGETWMNVPDHAYLRCTRHKAKAALKRGDYEHVSLFIRRRYNNYGRDG